MNKAIASAVVLAAAITFEPSAQADGNAANLPQLIANLYTQVQQRCTPQTPPHFQSIQWDGGGPYQLGSGRIIDANPSLGGPFQYGWNLGPDAQPGWRSVRDPNGNGYWDVNFEFC
jgi:hypothetical protein